MMGKCQLTTAGPPEQPGAQDVVSVFLAEMPSAHGLGRILTHPKAGIKRASLLREAKSVDGKIPVKLSVYQLSERPPWPPFIAKVESVVQ